MIIVRDIFRLKFGQSREATSLWKQALPALQKSGYGRDARLLTDLAGESYYTLVLETSHDSVAQWEQSSQSLRDNSEWRDIYQKITTLTESGRREILSVVE